MVLGLRSKHRKANSVQVDYQVHVKEIKPWPPSQTLGSVQSVLLQWKNGDQSSGYLSSSVGNGNIEFYNSFLLSVTLCREKRARDSFQKNCLEFYLYEPRKDKPAKGQLLGTFIINLAEYGIINENLTISIPFNSKKSSKNTAQPVLFVSVQPFDKESSNSSPKSSLSKDASLDKDGGESVLELMNGENDDVSEIASFTDDDESSHSSKTVSSYVFENNTSYPQNEESGSEAVKDRTERSRVEPSLPFGVVPAKSTVNLEAESFEKPNSSSHQSSSTILSTDLERSVNDQAFLVSVPTSSVTRVSESTSSSLAYQKTNDESDNYARSSKQEDLVRDFYEEDTDGNGKIKGIAQKPATANVVSLDTHANVKSESDTSKESHSNREDFGQASRWSKTVQLEKKEERENGEEENFVEEKMHPSENNLSVKVSQDFRRNQGTLRSETLTLSRRAIGMQGTVMTNSKLKHVKSVMLPFDSSKDKFHGNHSREAFVDRDSEWKSRIEVLEEELREAAVLEAALYSIVAEHGGSTNKVHAPARRLSRFYLHACKARSGAKKANAARAVVSGLVLVSKACGNDVPRLAFWLSNSILLRAILNQTVADTSLSNGTHIERNGGGTHLSVKSSLKGEKPFPIGTEKNHSTEEFDDWEYPQTFTIALEKVESWIFSRIVESIWWQTLTPHMQSTAAKTSGRANGSSSKKTYGSRSVMGNQDQGNFSVELWNKAFKDACERLCPIRAGGHECGCLPVMARLVMEQLVSRLDVAMFNAILRESDDEMPTDPVSDPISDSKVLPIPAGKSSFGAGAQLKNAVGNWSLWLTDLFGTEDNDVLDDTNDVDNENGPAFDTSFKAFPLLNALSDLMMLPFEMLADRSTRKEVCPTFGVPLITRVLENFIPDEFCPDPVPVTIFETLDAEDVLETSGESFTSFPCTACPTVYSPPPPASLARIIGEIGIQSLQRSGSSLLRKSYTSDDELDELDSPITSIVIDSSRFSPVSISPNWFPKGKGGRNVVRYQLLREVWKDGE